MAVRVRTLTCGWLTTDAGGMVPGQVGQMRMPVGAFLVEHPTAPRCSTPGCTPTSSTPRSGCAPPRSSSRWSSRRRRSVTGQLAERGLAPDDVDVAVVSHLHFDHCGGLAQLPDARMVVQQAEWDAAFHGPLVEYGVFNPDDFDLGHDRQMLDGEHDLFGDGSVVVVPTPGTRPATSRC